MQSPDCGPHGNDNATPNGAWSHVRSAEYAVTRRICQTKEPPAVLTRHRCVNYVMVEINGTCILRLLGRYGRAEFDPALVHALKLVVTK